MNWAQKEGASNSLSAPTAAPPDEVEGLSTSQAADF